MTAKKTSNPDKRWSPVEPSAPKKREGHKPAGAKAAGYKGSNPKTLGDKKTDFKKAGRKPDADKAHRPEPPQPAFQPQPQSAEDAARDEERVAKVLARAGVASRREVERMIELGRVAINGKVLTTPVVKVQPGDIMTVDGAVVGEAEAARVWRYNKPSGLVTTNADTKGRPTVFDNLPHGLPRVISVGRLDLNTEGLLLLTNDGELARALELPATGLTRRYRARARGRITQAKLDELKDGITVEGVRYGAIEATIDKAKEGPSSANLWITVSLAEGKNREVRRVLEAVGLTVNRLIRLSYGPFVLGDLPSGAAEEVGPRVIRELLSEWIAPDRLPKGNAVAKPVGPAVTTTNGRPAQPGRRDKAQRPSTQAAEKPVYKAGWARPKPKAAAKPGAKPARASGAKGRPSGENTRKPKD